MKKVVFLTLVLAGCAGMDTTDNLAKACRAYNAVKVAAAFVPYPPLQAALIAVSAVVDPICANTAIAPPGAVQTVLDNTAKLGQLMEDGVGKHP